MSKRKKYLYNSLLFRFCDDWATLLSCSIFVAVEKVWAKETTLLRPCTRLFCKYAGLHKISCNRVRVSSLETLKHVYFYLLIWTDIFWHQYILVCSADKSFVFAIPTFCCFAWSKTRTSPFFPCFSQDCLHLTLLSLVSIVSLRGFFCEISWRINNSDSRGKLHSSYSVTDIPMCHTWHVYDTFQGVFCAVWRLGRLLACHVPVKFFCKLNSPKCGSQSSKSCKKSRKQTCLQSHNAFAPLSTGERIATKTYPAVWWLNLFGSFFIRR